MGQLRFWYKWAAVQETDRSRKMTDAVLEMMHDSVTAGHIDIRRTLAYTKLRFHWYKQRESVEL